MNSRLSLAELRRTTSCLETVFLSFLHSGVAGHEAGGLQRSAVLRVQGDQSAGNAVADGAGLTGYAAAGDGDDNVNLAQQIGSDQGLTDDQLQGCLLYTSPSPRDRTRSRMPSSA